MTDRKGLADTCLALAEDRGHNITPAVRCALRMASDALRQEPSVEEIEAFSRAKQYRNGSGNLCWSLTDTDYQAISHLYRREP